MKRIFIGLIVLCLAVAGMGFYVSPGMARTKVESFLHSVGFTHAAVSDISIRPGLITASNIKLDSYGLDDIGLLQATFEMPSLSLRDVRLENIRYSGTVKTLTDLIPRTNAALPLLPPGEISIKNATLDYSTPYGDIRVQADLMATPSEANGGRALQASVRADQYQLGFDTKWTGNITDQGDMALDGEMLEGRLKLGPVKLSRLNGWMAFRVTHAIPALSGQLEAGGGSISDVPLQNISLTGGHTDDAFSLFFRANASGVEGVRLSADMDIMPDKSDFAAVVDVKNSQDLFAFLDNVAQRKKKEVPESLRTLGPVNLRMDYEAEKRFPGGPLPFGLSAHSGDQDILSGNFLVYPDSFDVRGTAETDEKLAAALQKYLSIPDDKVTGKFLRLDGNIKSVMKEKSGVVTGIEHNASE